MFIPIAQHNFSPQVQFLACCEQQITQTLMKASRALSLCFPNVPLPQPQHQVGAAISSSLTVKQIISYDHSQNMLGTVGQTRPSDLYLVKICCSALCNWGLGMPPGRLVSLAVGVWFSPCYSVPGKCPSTLAEPEIGVCWEKTPLMHILTEENCSQRLVGVAQGATQMQTSISIVF